MNCLHKICAAIVIVMSKTFWIQVTKQLGDWGLKTDLRQWKEQEKKNQKNSNTKYFSEFFCLSDLVLKQGILYNIAPELRWYYENILQYIGWHGHYLKTGIYT